MISVCYITDDLSVVCHAWTVIFVCCITYDLLDFIPNVQTCNVFYCQRYALLSWYLQWWMRDYCERYVCLARDMLLVDSKTAPFVMLPCLCNMLIHFFLANCFYWVEILIFVLMCVCSWAKPLAIWLVCSVSYHPHSLIYDSSLDSWRTWTIANDSKLPCSWSRYTMYNSISKFKSHEHVL